MKMMSLERTASAGFVVNVRRPARLPADQDIFQVRLIDGGFAGSQGANDGLVLVSAYYLMADFGEACSVTRPTWPQPITEIRKGKAFCQTTSSASGV